MTDHDRERAAIRAAERRLLTDTVAALILGTATVTFMLTVMMDWIAAVALWGVR